MKLTERQYEVLAGLRAANENRHLTVESHRVGELIAQGYVKPPLEGASRSLASLTRRGLAKRYQISGVPYYGITRQGLDELARLLNIPAKAGSIEEKGADQE